MWFIALKIYLKLIHYNVKSITVFVDKQVCLWSHDLLTRFNPQELRGLKFSFNSTIKHISDIKF